MAELRNSNRRLQALQRQNKDVEDALERFNDQLARLNDGGANSKTPGDLEGGQNERFEMIERKLNSISRILYNSISHMRNNNDELKSLKNDVAAIGNNTWKILSQYQNILDKEISNTGLMELKNRFNRHALVDHCLNSTVDRPKNCLDLHRKGKPSGVYKIYPSNHKDGFMVLCEMSDGGGWTVIQNRYDGSQNFFLGWNEYKHGFGNLGGEFWLGLDNIYHLTGQEVNELFIELLDNTSTRKFARYSAFSIGSEVEGYPLKLLGGYSGDAEDSLIYHAGSRFSTKDKDQDEWDEGSCPRSHGGGWWYKACDTSNLNGRYLVGEVPDSFQYQGMYWAGFRGPQYSLKQSRMMVRPKDNDIS
ncbi:hypothetical protein HHI36_018285 [Cryptolaemus montrouzieri]|uniref:Fibrinogen C-terminal domain-containing protein n=1 Tax=Cryptolaemus montrouzieri TaxID=559131 RepID=A0ABD2NZM6_9CUCU